jgi:branched-chain amino acid aminotransferase
VERKIDRTELYIADECFMCGTGIQIAAVTRIEHRNIGTGSMGSITTRLRDVYFDAVNGRIAAYRDWLVPVYAEQPIQA